MQRRSLLGLGVASAVVLAVVGGGAALVQPGLVGAQLSAKAKTLFEALGKAILDGSLPAEPKAQTLAVAGLLDRVNQLVTALPPHAQAELAQLIAILVSAPGRLGLAGLAKDWPEASAAEVQQALQSMRVSSLSLRRQAYQALHDIVSGAYFSSPTTWAQLGYPGPTKI